MLILTRRDGEALILETSDGPVTVRRMDHNGRQTRVGIDAPEAVKVWQEELQHESRLQDHLPKR